MPMSPRLKMRRGRFGPGGFKGPVLKITAPANGSSLSQGGSPTILFTATAHDDLDGDIASAVEWFVAGPGSPATGYGSPSVAIGASVNLNAFLGFGSPQQPIVVFARSTDSGGKVSTTSITVQG